MKLPNGYGSVHKLSGNRRNPWRARKTVGWDIDFDTGKATQKYITIGYYPTQADALKALANYNEHPYDIKTNKITFADVYDKWSTEHFKEIVPSARRTWTSAYKHCAPLYSISMRDIRASHLEQTIKNADVGDNTKGRMKSMFNLMYKYALKHEIVDKNYASLCDSIKKPKPKIIRIPFSEQEINLLRDHFDIPFADMIYIGIYTGFRPQELAILKIADIDLDNMTIVGGLKTDAGLNRIVPIHPNIVDLVRKNYDQAVDMNSDFLFNDQNGQQGTYMTYDKYRHRFEKVMKRLKLNHKPHDTRHTFATKAKADKVDEYILKLIIGHEITDITEKVYTHRTIEDMRNEMNKIK